MKLTDDDIHELLNGGLGEAKAELMAVLDTELPADKATLSALTGIEPKLVAKHMQFLVRHRLARRYQRPSSVSWRLDLGALDTAEAIRRLPKGAKQQAEDPEVREAARARIERKRAERRLRRLSSPPQ